MISVIISFISLILLILILLILLDSDIRKKASSVVTDADGSDQGEGNDPKQSFAPRQKQDMIINTSPFRKESSFSEVSTTKEDSQRKLPGKSSSLLNENPESHELDRNFSSFLSEDQKNARANKFSDSGKLLEGSSGSYFKARKEKSRPHLKAQYLKKESDIQEGISSMKSRMVGASREVPDRK